MRLAKIALSGLVAASHVVSAYFIFSFFVLIGIKVNSVAKLCCMAVTENVIVGDNSPTIENSVSGPQHNRVDIFLRDVIVKQNVECHRKVHANNIFSNLFLRNRKNIVDRQRVFKYLGLLSIPYVVRGGFSGIVQIRNPLKSPIRIAILVRTSSNRDAQISPQFSFCRFIGRVDRLSSKKSLPSDKEEGHANSQSLNSSRPSEQSAPIWRMVGCLSIAAGLICLGCGDCRRWRTVTSAGLLCLIGWVCIAGHTDNPEENHPKSYDGQIFQHNRENVSQKRLTSVVLL
jgi:hypothetical protein